MARAVDPFHATVANINNFLASKFQEGREYATLNVYRSALSAFHPEIAGHKVGQHPEVKQFLTGVFNMRPPLPKYSETWDVKIVLDYMKAMGENEQMTDKDLTQKLVMLLSLTNAARAHEVQNLSLVHMEDYGNKIVIHIPNLTKTKRPGKAQISMTLQVYPDDKQLDVVECLRTYLMRTKSWRVTPAQNEKILLALVEPHKPISTATVSRWVKDVMGKAGIDTEKFKAHSVRGAATTKAFQGGLSVAQILQKANWSRSNTFYKYYYKGSITKNDFQEKVLK
jgi:hypothetical protein